MPRSGRTVPGTRGSTPCASVCQFCKLSGTMTAIAGDWEGEAKEAENR